MSRGRKLAAAGIGLVAVIAAVGVISLGFVGVNQNVRAGTQTKVCGAQVGVTVSGDTVRLLGVSDESLSPGDRARVNALCVVEVVSIDAIEAAPDTDGAGPSVHLKWRLW